MSTGAINGVGVGPAGEQERDQLEPVATLIQVQVGASTASSSRGACTSTRPYGSEMNDDP
jgi:hypothetical protein